MDQRPLRFIHWEQVDRWCNRIACQMLDSNWKPDVVVGLLRGGGVPGTIISHIIDVPFYGLNVSSTRATVDPVYQVYQRSSMKVLVVDDINDTGKTLIRFRLDNDNGDGQTRYATLVDNLSSNFHEVSYAAEQIDKSEKDEWLIFPWENYRD